MADVVRRVDYYYALLRNEVGTGARVLDELAARRVDLLGFSGFPSGRRVQLDFIPRRSADLVRAARQMRMRLSAKKRCFLINGADKRGAIGAHLRKLATAGIGVTAVDAVSAGNRRYGALLWVDPADYTRAARVLGARR